MRMQDVGIWEITVIALICALYFLPTFIAVTRKHNDSVGIMTLNILLGWTFLGWLGSLIWSLKTDSN